METNGEQTEYEVDEETKRKHEEGRCGGNVNSCYICWQLEALREYYSLYIHAQH